MGSAASVASTFPRLAPAALAQAGGCSHTSATTARRSAGAVRCAWRWISQRFIPTAPPPCGVRGAVALDFQDRATCTSAKNFQLQLPREKPCKEGDVELLFGKTAANTFVLDYKHPLGMAQAFGIALSTRDWQ